MSPEPINERPLPKKAEIRGGDKLSDYVPNMDDEGTYLYADEEEAEEDGFLDDDAWDDYL